MQIPLTLILHSILIVQVFWHLAAPSMMDAVTDPRLYSRCCNNSAMATSRRQNSCRSWRKAICPKCRSCSIGRVEDGSEVWVYIMRSLLYSVLASVSVSVSEVMLSSLSVFVFESVSEMVRVAIYVHVDVRVHVPVGHNHEAAQSNQAQGCFNPCIKVRTCLPQHKP